MRPRSVWNAAALCRFPLCLSVLCFPVVGRRSAEPSARGLPTRHFAETRPKAAAEAKRSLVNLGRNVTPDHLGREVESPVEDADGDLADS